MATEAQLENERATFETRQTQLIAIEDAEERLEELEKDAQNWQNKYRRRLKTFTHTIRNPEDTNEFLEALELAYEDLRQSQEFYKVTCTHIIKTKSELHQEEDEVKSAKRQLANDFERQTRIHQSMEDEVLLNMRQARREAVEARTEQRAAEYRKQRLEDEAAIAREQQAQAEARAQPAVAPNTAPRTNERNPIGKVKRIDLPQFDGKTSNFFKWKSTFDILVKNNPDLNKTTKFLYLDQALTGEAHRIMEHLEHSEISYDLALTSLEEKYGGKEKQLQSMYRQIKDIRPVKDFHTLQDYQYVLLGVLSVMKNQNINLKDQLVHLQLCEKMNQRLMKEYVFFRERNGSEGVIETLIDFVNKEVQASQTAYEATVGASKFQHTSYGGTHKKSIHNLSKDPKFKAEKAGDTGRVKKCVECEGAHTVWECQTYKKKSLNDKLTLVRKKGLCFKCLNRGHRKEECRSKSRCSQCGKGHHTLLHDSARALDTPKSIPPANEETKDEEKIVATVNSSPSAQVVINLIPVLLHASNNKRKVRCLALIDSGSNTTLISEQMKRKLGLHGHKQTHTYHHPITDQGLRREVEVLDAVVLESIEGNCNITMTNVETMPGALQAETVDWNYYKANFPHLRDLDFPQVYPQEHADLLIGSDQTLLFQKSDQRVPKKNGDPIATKTPLGWLCMGIIPRYKRVTNNSTPKTLYHIVREEEEETNSILRKFWELEDLKNTRDEMSLENREVTKKIKDTRTYDGNRYTVTLPFNQRQMENPTPTFKKDMWSKAMARLRSTEYSLKRSDDRKQKYTEVINGYIDKGYARKVEDPDDTMWLLPHFPVIREERETTKLRIVFDGAAKIQNLSLNDQIQEGPKLQRDIFEVLLRFRRYGIAINCDIKEMFLGISVTPHDSKYLRILWRNMEDRSPDVIELLRVTFGINASPFLAISTLLDHAERYRCVYPRAVEALTCSTYVDDTLDSVESQEEAIELYNNISTICKEAGWRVHKWSSNDKSFLSHVPVEDQAQGCPVKTVDAAEMSIKTLGVRWMPETDQFIGESTEIVVEDQNITKRFVLKKMAKIYDPLGMMSPYVMQCKMLLQEIWKTGSDWDETLNENLRGHVLDWIKGLRHAGNVQLSRPLFLQPDQILKSELHCFVDASAKAFGAVIYIKITYAHSTVIKWVAAKGKVCPLDPVSIPRLELLAATLGAQMTDKIVKALQYDKLKVFMWTDSMTALWWIRGRTRNLKMFVANRVLEILKYTDPSDWRYLPTKQNPADLISRGCNLEDLCCSELWKNGPTFLQHDSANWPTQNIVQPKETIPEIKKQYIDKLVYQVLCDATEDEVSQELSSSDDDVSEDEENDPLLQAKKDDHIRNPVCTRASKDMGTPVYNLRVEPGVNYLEPIRFSSLQKLIRVRAYVKRFLHNVAVPVQERTKGSLTVWELAESENEIISQEQKKIFKREYKALLRGQSLHGDSKLLALNPQLDQDGVMRVGGRIREHPSMPWCMQCPIILPKNDYITDLIIQREHERNHMFGTNYLMGKLKERFWILSARSQIQLVTRRCLRCKRLKHQVLTQQMGLLPVTRTQIGLRAFIDVGVDMAGPIMIKIGRGKPQQKRWICLFTCLATRAVHLELCTSLDIDSFMNALARFIGRRGVPKSMVSDNGTNFRGADNDMKRLYEAFESTEFQDKCSTKQIIWKFNPPGGPHHGGVFEAMIKAAKTALKHVMFKRDLTEEELLTALVSAEGMINQRPLSYVGSDQEDFILTPNHFLHGSLGGMIAPEVLDNTPTYQKKWRMIQNLLQEIWARWLREWVSELNKRKKWFKPEDNLLVDDIVLIIEEDQFKTRGDFPLGRVMEVHTGGDGLVRSCKVKTADGKLHTKTIQKLAKIESNKDDV
jgi:hypothetical protein